MNHSDIEKYIPSLREGVIRHYLTANGWIDEGSFNQIAAIWHRIEPKYEDQELIQPSTSAGDYIERLYDLLRNLSKFEKKELKITISDIILFSVDLVSVQVSAPDVDSGTIPIDDGILLNKKARDLLRSAALSTVSKKRNFTNQRSPETINYLQRLRLGQTGYGSYIINVVAPIETTKSQEDIDDTLPFSRLVTLNLIEAVQSLKEKLDAFDTTNDITTFESTVDRGASANMCDALIGLSGKLQNREFKITISPSATIKSELANSVSYNFTQLQIKNLVRASSYFKENYTLPDKKFRGQVKKLNREPEAETGLVTITAQIGNLDKEIVIELAGKDYLAAIHAHETRLFIECAGDLHVTPKTKRLLNVKYFKPLETPLFDNNLT